MAWTSRYLKCSPGQLVVWRIHRLNPISIKTKQNRKALCLGVLALVKPAATSWAALWRGPGGRTEGGRCLEAREEVKPFLSPALRWQYPRPTPCPLWDPEPENPAEACLDFCKWQTANILSFLSHTLPVSLLPLFNLTTWRKGVTDERSRVGADASTVTS